MEQVIGWLSENWWWLAIVAAVMVNMANAVSRHWSEHAGVVKIFTFVAEALSIVTSPGARTKAGVLKFPFTSVRPGSSSGDSK